MVSVYLGAEWSMSGGQRKIYIYIFVLIVFRQRLCTQQISDMSIWPPNKDLRTSTFFVRLYSKSSYFHLQTYVELRLLNSTSFIEVCKYPKQFKYFSFGKESQFKVFSFVFSSGLDLHQWMAWIILLPSTQQRQKWK